MYSTPAGTAAVSDATISSTAFNTLVADIAEALTDSLSKSGNGAASADLSMGSHKLTSVTDPASAQDAATKNYVDTTAQAVNAELTALAALSTTGLIARTASATYVPRTITVTGPGISIANGDGVAGAPAITIVPTVVGGFRNLKIQATSDTAVAITADAMTLEDSSGNGHRATAVSLTLGTGTAGANGLDAGSLGASTWYAVWAIFNPAGPTLASLISLSATAPTLPSGYTYMLRVGWVRTDGSKHLLRTLQLGRRAQYIVGTNPAVVPNIANGVAGTFSTTSPVLAAVSVANVVPSTAAAIHVAITGNYTGASGAGALAAPNTGWGGTNNGPAGSAGNVWALVANVNNVIAAAWIVLEATTIAWTGNGTASAVSCLGWEDNL